MDAFVEPSPCMRALSAEAGGLHYSWGGRKAVATIGVYNVETEQWTLTPTTGSPPPGLRSGGCVIILNHLYCFGGWDGSCLFNDLYKLNLETFQWSKVHPNNDPSMWPEPKYSCGLVPVDARTLVCFGGWGDGQWTNEFHLFNIQEGIYIVPLHFICICISYYPGTSVTWHILARRPGMILKIIIFKF